MASRASHRRRSRCPLGPIERYRPAAARCEPRACPVCSAPAFPGSSAVEQSAVNRRVVGSNPARGAISIHDRSCADGLGPSRPQSVDSGNGLAPGLGRICHPAREDLPPGPGGSAARAWRSPADASDAEDRARLDSRACGSRAAHRCGSAGCVPRGPGRDGHSAARCVHRRGAAAAAAALHTGGRSRAADGADAARTGLPRRRYDRTRIRPRPVATTTGTAPRNAASAAQRRRPRHPRRRSRPGVRAAR